MGMSTEKAEDRDLVASFLDGREEAAFRELYRRHTAALFLLASRLLGGGRGAEDAVQETWIRATARLGHFRWESSLKTWLCGITVNLCREMLRERAAGATTSALPEATAHGHPRHAGGDGIDRLDLERAIRRLPAGYREVLVLHDVEGHTHEEIAALLQIEAGTSKSQLHKARRAIRAALMSPAPKGAGEDDHEA